MRSLRREFTWAFAAGLAAAALVGAVVLYVSWVENTQ
jgi:hypothetical protein